MSLYFSTVDYGMDNMRYGGSGGHRTSIGYQTLRDDNYKMDHTKWGYLNNTAFGFKCLHKTTTAKGNTAFGIQCGYEITTQHTDGIEDGSGNPLTSYQGSWNTFMGAYAGEKHTWGNYNVCIGAFAAKYATTLDQSCAIGFGAMESASTAHNNNAVGHMALNDLTAGEGNNVMGAYAGDAITTGDFNTCVGEQAGTNLSTGGNNLCLGYRAGTSNSPSGNIAASSNKICLGDDNITNIYCEDTGISSSDLRDKTDISDFTKGLDWIKALRPVTYRWDKRTWYGTDAEPYGTPDGSKKKPELHVGFLAQEALEVEKANGYATDNNNMLMCNLTDDGMRYGMKYERLVPVLVNAIKELSARVEQLEAS